MRFIHLLFSLSLLLSICTPVAMAQGLNPTGGISSPSVRGKRTTTGVPLSSDVTVVPNVLKMVVGETHAIQSLNTAGQPVAGLLWASSDPSVVSLSTADPPVLTAVAPGQVTITAGLASVEVTVFATELPAGTAIWSNPGNGSGVQSIVPAVPSPDGVADVFSFQGDGTVQAVRADGTTAWTADVSRAAWRGVQPDFSGGLIVYKFDTDYTSASVVRLDGVTGAEYPAYALGEGNVWSGSMGIHPDGTVFAVKTVDESTYDVVGIDPITGTQKFTVPIQGSMGPISTFGWGGIGQPSGPIIAGDGYAYLPYVHREDPCTGIEHLEVLRIGTDGAYDNIPVLAWQTNSCEWDWLQAYTITNVDQGVFLSWGGNCVRRTAHAVDIRYRNDHWHDRHGHHRGSCIRSELAADSRFAG